MNNFQVVDRCDFQPGQIIDNQYTVRKTLGEGSFGVVYLVEDRYHTRRALKLLRLWEVPSDIRQPLMDRFDMEFKTGQIPCEQLVQSLAYGTVGGNPFIVMEFCPGGDMEPYLGRVDARTPRICHDILVGLSALHSHGKVHRDLKPENVLFKENGTAALTDFGIAGDRTNRMTQRNIFGKPNQIFGTYAYMPPEQFERARGDATVLPTTDIFSFGVLAYQLLTGRLPFGSLESHNDLAMYQGRSKKGQWDHSALMSVPNGQQWERLLGGCLLPDFKQRTQSVSDIARMIPYGGYAPAPSSRVKQPAPQAPQPQLHAYRPAAQTHGYLLRVMQGEEHGRTYDLSQLVRQGRRVITVGRMPDNNVFVKSGQIDYMSRYHCTIEVGSTQWAIRDGQWHSDIRQWKNSSNGTYVNSRPVGGNGYYIRPGDIITLGDVTLRFENY